MDEREMTIVEVFVYKPRKTVVRLISAKLSRRLL
jgi:hypothetical protein